MRLDAKQLHKARIELNKLSPYTPVIYENGYFEYHNISDESDFKRLKDLLEHTLIVKNINYTNSKYNFNHFTFNKGYAEPSKTYTIRGLLDENMLIESIEENKIEENIEIHNSLNPKIWDDEKNLRPEVRNKIIQIAETFIKQVKEDGVDLKVVDIYLLGSNANYNYNDDSDLDIHLIADESFDCSQEHLSIIYNAYKTLFNKKYGITIRGINVELYVENKDQLTNVATGIYSLKNGWIKEPARANIPEINTFEFDKKVNDWENKYFEITQDPSIEKIDDYVDSIYDLRQTSISNEGEFGLNNLVFKEIRRRGYLDDLKDLKTKLTSQELSLDETI